MKTRNLATLMFVLLSLSISSCKDDEPTKDLTVTIVTESVNHSEYIGNMAVTGARIYTRDNYKVTVEKIDNNTIKIVPEDSNATSFTVALKEGSSGAIVSEDATLGVSFTENNGNMILSYGYINNGSTEAFSEGVKQN